MCKEAPGCHIAEAIEREEQHKADAKHGFRTMRHGKTRKDTASGAHDRLLQNRVAEAEVNRGFHGSTKKK